VVRPHGRAPFVVPDRADDVCAQAIGFSNSQRVRFRHEVLRYIQIVPFLVACNNMVTWK